MLKGNVIIIRNAAHSDFGGGERVPVFIAREVIKNSQLKPIIFSRSKKLLSFSKQESVPCIKTWWWDRQNWSGKKMTLIPIYIAWQVILYVYYVFMFTKYKASIVHLQSKDDFIAGTLAAKTLGCRVIWTDHADLKHIFANHRIWYKNPIGKMVYFAAHFAELITVVSNEDKSIIMSSIPTGTISAKMRIVYNGAFDAYKPTKKLDIFTFVSSSRLVTDKGIGETIRAFDKINKSYPNTAMRFIGDGPEKARFEKLAAHNKNIIFLGHKDNPLDLINECHVYILATYHEGFSLALVEACMLNMPIIATNIGGNKEIIFDSKTGLLVPIKDSNSLYKAMEVLINDSELRQLIANNARKQYVDRFQFDKVINKEFISVYESK